MHDIRDIRLDPAAFETAMLLRGEDPGTASRLLEFDVARRTAEAGAQACASARNDVARRTGAAMKAGRRDEADALRAEGKLLAARLSGLEAAADAASRKLAEAVESLPNRAADGVPVGADETGNVVVATHGETVASGLPHWNFCEALGLDTAAGAALSGARFSVLRDGAARMERALGQFMLDLHVDEHGYRETAPPLMVCTEIMHGTGQLPKFAADLFRLDDDRWLIPTSEVPLTNLVRGRTLDAADLPMRAAALTPCFRSEAGAAGRDTRGYMRQHQFGKVEMVSVVLPEDAAAEHERMTRCAETVLERLGLSWRRVELCTGDLGFSAQRTFDLEVWMAGQGAWREISSCSTCGDFQARRMGTRIRGRKDLPHTLNGSGVATGRALVAVMEAFVDDEGGVSVPAVLRPYMRGVERIAPRDSVRQPGARD